MLGLEVPLADAGGADAPLLTGGAGEAGTGEAGPGDLVLFG